MVQMILSAQTIRIIKNRYSDFRYIIEYLDKCCNFASVMRIIAKRTLIDFYTKHEDVRTALEEWHKKAKEAKWNSFADVKKTFRSADSVGNSRFVFNIKGNNYRLIALILFSTGMVYIRFVGTHANYDRITDIKNI